MSTTQPNKTPPNTRPAAGVARSVGLPSALGRSCLVGLVRLYQLTLGVVLPDCCRFSPTCSDYFIQAVQKFGALRGAWLGTKRILRCNPYCKGGHDPIP